MPTIRRLLWLYLEEVVMINGREIACLTYLILTKHSPRHFISNPETASTGRHPPPPISRHSSIINNVNLPIIWIHHKVFLDVALQEAIMNQSLQSNRLNETHLPSLINIKSINKEHFAVQ